jgi:hypothetical protein
MSGFFCHKATPSSNPGFLQISRVQNGASLDVAAKIKLEHGLIILCLKESQPERHRLALFCSLATRSEETAPLSKSWIQLPIYEPLENTI